MSEENEPCPHCGSTKRMIRYNKWHVREVYCGECYRCLNQDFVTKQTALASRASQEDKLTDFWMGTYQHDDESSQDSEE